MGERSITLKGPWVLIIVLVVLAAAAVYVLSAHARTGSWHIPTGTINGTNLQGTQYFDGTVTMKGVVTDYPAYVPLGTLASHQVVKVDSYYIDLGKSDQTKIKADLSKMKMGWHFTAQLHKLGGMDDDWYWVAPGTKDYFAAQP